MAEQGRLSRNKGGGAKQHAELPSDAVAVRKVLKAMGVEEYEPRVVPMLLDFMYRYTSEVILDADAYSEQVGRTGEKVDTEDVMLAIQARAAAAFVPQPSHDVLADVATKINSRPLLALPEKVFGLRLPKEPHMLVQPGWQVEPPAQ